LERIRVGNFSAKTNIPYRAGRISVERALRQTFDEKPALCLAFFSERYSSPDLVEGITLRVNADIVAGCSTSGEIPAGYERESVNAFIIASDYMRFGIAVESNEILSSGSDDIYRKFYERAVFDLQNKMLLQESKMVVPDKREDIIPDYGMIFLPGTDIETHPRADEVVRNLRKHMGNLPLIGGTCGDDFKYEKGYVIYKDEFLVDHTLLILCRSDLKFSMAQTHGYSIREEFKATQTRKHNLEMLNNKSASEIYFGALNIPVVEISDLRDEICALNPLAINDDNTDNIQILFPMTRGRGASDLVMSQTIPEGKKVYLMEADIERSKSASLECFKAAFASSTIKDPRLGMMFSCVGRSTFYFGRAHEEIDEIRKRFKYTDIGGAYLYGTICGENNYISEGTTSTLLIGNDLQDRTVKEE